jgi:hypothetical protein
MRCASAENGFDRAVGQRIAHVKINIVPAEARLTLEHRFDVGVASEPQQDRSKYVTLWVGRMPATTAEFISIGEGIGSSVINAGHTLPVTQAPFQRP